MSGWRRTLARARARLRAQRVRNKIVLLPLVSAGGFAIVVAASAGLAVGTRSHLDRLERVRYPALEVDRRLRDVLEATQGALLDAVTAADADRVAAADSLRAVFERTLAASGAPDTAARRRAFAAYYASARRASGALLAGASSEDARRAIEPMVARYTTLRADLDARVVADARANEAEFRAVRALQARLWAGTVVAVAAALAALAGLALAAVRGLVRPLDAAVAVAERLTAGEVDVTFPRAGRDEVGRLLRALGVMVAHLRAAQRAAAETGARFEALVQHSSDVVVVLDQDGVIAYASAASKRVFGHEHGAFRGRPVVDLVHPDDVPSVVAAVAELRDRPGAVVRNAHRVRHADGSWRHIETVGTNLLADPAVRGLVFNARDVTERTELEARLAHQAFHDPLTGLANRALFRDRVEHALERLARTGAPPAEAASGVAVLFLDLDNFKNVNDSLGHDAGDRLLCAVAARLLNATRGCDTVARFGGDEFAVLLEHVRGEEDALAVAERVTAALRTPVPLGHAGGDDAAAQVGASVGVSFAEPAMAADELLRNADAAMYDAKRAGKGRFAVFDPVLVEAATERLQLAADLGHALAGAPAGGELLLAYQPIVALDTGAVVSAEALARWRHPSRGAVSPAVFIPVAEDSGLIVELGRRVLEEACRTAATWPRAEGGHAAAVTVNVSGRQLQDAEFPAQVRAALADSGLEPARLTLEITESVIMRDTDATLAQLTALKALGVRLAVDDFGTGYSSLSYLQKFPVDVLKIDKSFVDGVARGGHHAALARTIVALGETLSLRTVAEGVEEPVQQERLRAMGCQLGQGYLFARPLDAAAMLSLLRAPTPARG